MDLWMWLPPAAALVLGQNGKRLGRLLPPATAVRLLTAAAVIVALATGFVLAVTGFVVLAELPSVAALGRWSAAAVRAGDPVPPGPGLLAAVTVVVLLGSALHRAARAGRDLAAAALACRRLGPGANGLVIVVDDQPAAYALPGIRGRIVVSTAMMRSLPADERRVLLAHEAAHLKHRHHLYAQLADLAASANPMLRPVARAVRLAVERWADEVAAAEVGDRQLTARALARAGLARIAATSSVQAPTAALAAVDGAVADRARAVLAGPPPARRGLVAAIATLVLLTTGAAVQTAHFTEDRFERAQALYTAPR